MRFIQHVTALGWACGDAHQELQPKSSTVTSYSWHNYIQCPERHKKCFLNASSILRANWITSNLMLKGSRGTEMRLQVYTGQFSEKVVSAFALYV